MAQYRAAAEEAGDTGSDRHAINQSATLATQKGDVDHARRLFLETYDAAGEYGHRWLQAYSMVNLSWLHLEAGDYEACVTCSAKAADLFREDEDESGLVVALMERGSAKLCLADLVGAEGCFREALVLAGQIEATHRIAPLTLLLGPPWSPEETSSAACSSSAPQARSVTALNMPPYSDALEQRVHEQAVSDAKEALGEDAYAVAWKRGGAMTPADIVRVAAGDEPAPDLDTS